MNILVVGSGGREHAIAWKLNQSQRCEKLYCAPGNAGTAAIAENIDIPFTDMDVLADFAETNDIGLTVIGPDDALAGGIVDVFEARGLRVFGPRKNAALLEASKIFAKEFMLDHGIPTAKAGKFDNSEDAIAFLQDLDVPVVIKADGLALGKGVIIAETREAAEQAIRDMIDGGQFGDAGKRVLVEEFLTGSECSIHAIFDTSGYLTFPPAQDHKRALDNDKGLNTGGMGTFSPPPAVDAAMMETIDSILLKPFLQGTLKDGLEFKGMLFPGLMLTPQGPSVLEFNCRFGDPETQVLLPRLKSDLVDLFEAAINDRIGSFTAEWDPRAAVCVVMASGGYPESYAKGKEISGLEQFDDDPDIVVFHAGTALKGDMIVTSGGRVLGVTALGSDLRDARDKAYAAVEKIHFENAHYRTDIGAKGLDS